MGVFDLCYNIAMTDKNNSLYQKYRPSDWGEVLGQSHVVDVLEKSIANERISHAYLFFGTRGTGKTSIARIFAEKGRDSTPAKFLWSLEVAGQMYNSLGPILEKYDVLVCPTTALPAVKADFDQSRDTVEINGKQVNPMLGWVMTSPFNTMSRCPVLTVPFEAEAMAATAPVLVAIDFSERSGIALKAGHALAALYGAEVELVHVVRDAGPYPGFAPNILSLVDYDPAQGEAVRKRMKRFVDRMEGPVPAAYHVSIGSPSRVIPALAAQRGAGAIVMGTHGRQGIAHALIGSVAEATLRRSTCPVLTLKEIHTQKDAVSP